MLVIGGAWKKQFSNKILKSSGTTFLESQTKFVHEPLMETYWILDLFKFFVQDKFFHEHPRNMFGVPEFQQCQFYVQKWFLVILNVCVSLLVACCYLHSQANKQTMKNNKREEQQEKKNRQQEEITYIRRGTTNNTRPSMLYKNVRPYNVRNNTQQERR